MMKLLEEAGLSNVLTFMLVQGGIQRWERLSQHVFVCRLLQEPHETLKAVSTCLHTHANTSLFNAIYCLV